MKKRIDLKTALANLKRPFQDASIWFNINDYVYVKLTERGKKVYLEHYAKYNDPKIKAPHRNKIDSKLGFQLYELMIIFGGSNTPDWFGEVNFEQNEIFFNL